MNQFKNILPLINLIKEKGRQYKCIDISNVPIDNYSMQNGLIQAISSMSNLEELYMSECFEDHRKDIQFEQSIKLFIEQLFRGCKLLRMVDISRNYFSKENLNCLFKMIKMHGNNSIEALSIS